MPDAFSNFASGQKLRLVRAVLDDETGYHFPAGTPAHFEEYLAGEFCLVALEKSLGDSSDSGTVAVMVGNDDVETA
ncbi:hypothetical protein AB4Y45_34210 [Paraburkholderia sp. EG287A]|uniref:hypothetical protein n=1 Tax=Paraburkholderia sp. EG287A TaxID=3237012 RepID=UPI0034D27B18